MKILLLNQTFYPDVVSTAQHLTELAVSLAERGHDVTVVAGSRAYDDPAKRFLRRETWRDIEILRVPSTAFGKCAKWRRALDFATFIVSCCWRLLWLPPQDTVVALTSPPLISFIAALFTRVRGGKFIYWVMDLNPDEAIAAGWLREGSLPAKVLQRMSRFSFHCANKVVVLDTFMRARVEAKGIAPEKISVIAPWSHDDEVGFDPRGREQFRKTHGLGGKFVVMYSGNHSPCHPLDTLLGAAKQLSADARFVFLFVGGGSEFPKVKKFARENYLTNILCLPYQPLDQLAGSLSAADLHAVVMGDSFVGMIHPCKIYNVLSVGAPVIYIGPESSHVGEILAQLDSRVCGRVSHGEAARCVSQIRAVASGMQRGERETYARTAAVFSSQMLLPRFIEQVEADSA